MNIVICDDERSVIEKYKKQIIMLGEKNNITTNVTGHISGEQLLFELEEDPNQVDLIYMDIGFGDKMDGLSACSRLRKTGYTKEIVFLTRKKDRVLDSFDVEPLNFIVKDETPDKKFEEVFLRAAEKTKSKNREFISLSCAGESRNIPLDTIYFFEVVNRIIVVHYGDDETFEFYSTIGKLENMLFDKGFMRIHRTFLISASKVRVLSGQEITMVTGDVQPIGRTYMKAVKAVIKARK